MQLGYLSIETHSDRPDALRLVLSAQCPAIPEGVTDTPRRVRYVARFNDGEAALMHTHQLLRRRLVDVNTHLYRCDLATAIVAVESLGLSHGRIYLDPQMDRSSIEARAAALEGRRRRRDRFWYGMGYIALGFLLLNGLVGLFR